MRERERERKRKREREKREREREREIEKRERTSNVEHTKTRNFRLPPVYKCDLLLGGDNDYQHPQAFFIPH